MARDLGRQGEKGPLCTAVYSDLSEPAWNHILKAYSKHLDASLRGHDVQVEKGMAVEACIDGAMNAPRTSQTISCHALQL
ncbi:hypothetical protein, partial [Desulfogranum mediterraneum]|uniref:hypothetical protein n=1 Tax=Desulfogranum mediterraneum TaxID=160661 RepID=UPI0004918BC0